MSLDILEKLISTNSTLGAELYWLNEILEAKSLIAAGETCSYKSVFEITPPEIDDEDDSIYAQVIRNHNFGFSERVVLILTLAPHLQPNALDIFKYDARSIHGGQNGKSHRGFLPTGETALFILGGKNVNERIEVQKLFDRKHPFVKDDILYLADVEPNEPRMSGLLNISEDFLDMLIHGKKMPPKFGKNFPAKSITTEMEWEDLILSPHTHGQIDEVKLWLKHYPTIKNDEGMKRKLRPGYKVLFHGPPGTGKTLAARLLGKETKREVFRIDLSMMVSKYIGETEKNLAKVFDKAEHSDWILFFDEADALFGSRTGVSSSHDRYANQEVSFLLQRIEDYDGLVILASNFKNNIDNAFLRRFDAMVHFPSPKPDERFKLWKMAFPKNIILADDVQLQQIAQTYEITGAHIANIVAHTMLYVAESGSNTIDLRQLKQSIGRELGKEGRTM
jgi:hypothetical protein